MKPIYKLAKWVPSPHTGTINRWTQRIDFWIGLANNKSPGIKDFLEADNFDFIDVLVFLEDEDDDDDFDFIDFWRGLSANKEITNYLLNHFYDDFDEATTVGDNINWDYMCQHNESPFVVDFCKKYPENICWDAICRNQLNDSLLAFAGNYPEKLNWNELSRNPLPSAIEILKKYPNKITEKIVYNCNPDAFELLESIYTKIDWKKFNRHYHCYDYPNKNTVKLFKKYFSWMKIFHGENFINWQNWSKVPEAMSLLKENPDKIDWSEFCENKHPEAVNMLKDEKNRDKLDWEQISRNKHPDIVDFLDNNLKKLNLNNLVRRNNPNFAKLIEKYWNNPDFHFLFGVDRYYRQNRDFAIPNEFFEIGPYGQYIDRLPLTDWDEFARRPECIHLLKDTFENGIYLKEMEQHNNFYRGFYSNPAIFELDKEAMTAQNKQFAEELMAKVFHPERVQKILEKYNYNILTEETCYPSDSDEET